MINIDNDLKEYGKNHKVPISLDDTLDFLIKTINDSNSKYILEIGTAIGYSSIAMAENTDCIRIDSVEIDQSRHLLAKDNVAKHNLLNRISLYNGDALEYIKNTNKTYDFIYLDGPKGQYINYLPHLMKILKINGIIFADNLYFHGMVTGSIPVSKGCRAMIKGLHRYIDEINSNPNLDTKIYDIGDGIGISKRIK